MPFEELYKQNYKIVYGYIFRLCNDAQLTEELTAETFYKALRSFKRFKGKSKLSTWLCSIAKNEFMHYCRKNKHYNSLSEFYDVPDDTYIEDIVQDKDTALTLHKLLRKLEPSYKEVFILRVFAQLSFREIAEVTEQTENWARVTYYRAKLKLRQQMEDSDV